MTINSHWIELDACISYSVKFCVQVHALVLVSIGFEAIKITPRQLMTPYTNI